MPALLRSRPGVVSDHFSLHWKALDAQPGVLMMSVPKRVLARAVDRNAVRRVAREAWRAASLRSRPVAILLKLRKRPEAFPEMPAGRRKAMWRAELDAAFARVGRARPASAAAPAAQ